MAAGGGVLGGALDNLEAMGGNAEEIAAIEDMRAVVMAYLDAVDTAESLVSMGVTANELDAQVKIDDEPHWPG